MENDQDQFIFVPTRYAVEEGPAMEPVAGPSTTARRILDDDEDTRIEIVDESAGQVLSTGKKSERLGKLSSWYSYVHV